jgi:hypothetical protein
MRPNTSVILGVSPLIVLVAWWAVASAQPSTKPLKRKRPTALELLVGERPSKAPLLSLAAFGTAAADLAAKLPAYDRDLQGAALRDASILPELADGKLIGYWINGFDHQETPTVLARLRAAWGEPEAGNNDIGPTYVWVDTDARVHLLMQVVRTTDKRDHSNLFLEQYSPLQELVGSRPGELAFAAARPLLGATTKQLAAAYGSRFLRDRIELGATEYTRRFGVRLTFEAGRVDSYALRFEHGANQRAILAGEQILRVVLGTVPKTPTIGLGGTPQKYVLAGGETVRFYAYKASWSLDVEAKR